MRGWRLNGHGIYNIPRQQEPRGAPIIDTTLQAATMERWLVHYPKTKANQNLYFVLVAHGPIMILGTPYVVFDTFVNMRCLDGDTIAFSYPGFNFTWQSADHDATFQDTRPPPTSWPSPGFAKTVNIVNPGTPGHALTIVISGVTATITLATDGSSAITTTYSQLQTAWNGNVPAAAWANLFTSNGSTLVAPDSGTMFGDYSHSFNVTAADLSWTVEYNNYDGTVPQGAFSIVMVSKQTGTYATTVGDDYVLNGSPDDDAIAHWATGLSVAQGVEPAIVDWAPAGSPPQQTRVGSISVPTTAKSGQDFAVTFEALDALSGSPVSVASSGETYLPNTNFGSDLEQVSTGSGASITDHVKIHAVGPYILSPVTPGMTKRSWSSVINITPNTPTQVVTDFSLVATPITGWRVTTTDADDVDVQGRVRNPDQGVQSVGHAAKLEVRLFDADDNQCTNATGKTCVLSIVDSGSPAKPVVLGGTLTRPFVNGVASFDDLTVVGLSVTSKLRATCPEISVHSDVAFTPCIFGFWDGPKAAKVGDLLTFTYKICDYWGNVISDLGAYDPVTVADGPLAGSFSGVGSHAPAAGVATIRGAFSTPGTFNLFAQGSQAKYKDSGYASPNVVVS